MPPQVRTLSQIMAELAPTYNPQVQAIKTRQSLIPQAIKAEEAGLEAKQGRAFEDILGGARRRGLGFSGIPMAEQAKYTATDYLPALARLRQSGQEQALTLEEALYGIQERQGTLAQQLREQEQNRLFNYEEAERNRQAQERASRAAAAAQAQATLGNLAQYLNPQAQTAQTDPEEARYQAWLNSQLKVSTRPTIPVTTGANGRVQGGSVRLQGGTPSLQSGGIKLQGKGATQARLFTAPTSGGLRVR